MHRAPRPLCRTAGWVSAWACARAGSCGRPPALAGRGGTRERGEGVGEMAANGAGIVGREHAGTFRPAQILTGARGLGRDVEGPAEMLTRVAPADGKAMVRQHLVVELDDDRELRGERR